MFLIINMAALKQSLSIKSHPIRVLDGIQQSLKGLSVVGNGKEEIDLGTSNKDKKNCSADGPVKDQHVINDFETKTRIKSTWHHLWPRKDRKHSEPTA